MNSANYVDEQIKILKTSGIPLAEATWQAALLTVGWAYVFGARGQYCTPSHRRARYNGTSPGKNKDNIKNRCKNFEGTGTCGGCKWFPEGLRTRDFDCRGFTYWILLQVYGKEIKGAGASSQWRTEANWKSKGTIDSIPADKLVCLFQQNPTNPAIMEHTGIGYKGETIECSNGVQHFTKMNKKWTHWAIPAFEEGDTPEPTPPTPPEPVPYDKRPTIRQGDRGEYVKMAQGELINTGYSCGKTGADGIFGKNTTAATKAFQRDHVDYNGKALVVDGIIGKRSWWALDQAQGRG